MSLSSNGFGIFNDPYLSGSIEIDNQSKITGNIIPMKDNDIDIGDSFHRIRNIYTANVIGNVVDADASVDTIRFGATGTQDILLYRSAPSVLTLNNNSSGPMTLNVNGTIKLNGVPMNSIGPTGSTGPTGAPFSIGSSTNSAVVLWNGTAGNNVKNSNVTIDSNGVITSSNGNNLGTVLQIGSQAGPLSSFTPSGINLGSGYSSISGATAGSTLKLKLYDDNSSIYGLGVSQNLGVVNSLDSWVPSGSKMTFYANNEVFSLDQAGVYFSTALKTKASTGNDLSLLPDGSNVNFNSKNITSASTINGLNLNINTGSNTGGLIKMGNSTNTSTTTPNVFDMGASVSSVAGANPKLKLYNDGINIVALGVSNLNLDQMVGNLSSFKWYTGGTNIMKLDNTSLYIPSITTQSGDLLLNSTTSNINLSSNNVIGANTLAIRAGSDTAGTVLQIGNASGGGISTTTPNSINLGRSYSSVAGSNLKLVLYDDGTTNFGIGISPSQLDYCTPTAGSHNFYIAGSKIATINTTGIIAPGLTTASGDLSLSASTSNINFNSKVFNSVGAINGSTNANNLYKITGNSYFRFNNGQTSTSTGDICIQTLDSPAGFNAINFNGYFNGSEQRFDATKRRWRVICSKSGTGDSFSVDSFDGTTSYTHLSIDAITANYLQLPNGFKNGKEISASLVPSAGTFSGGPITMTMSVSLNFINVMISCPTTYTQLSGGVLTFSASNASTFSAVLPPTTQCRAYANASINGGLISQIAINFGPGNVIQIYKDKDLTNFGNGDNIVIQPQVIQFYRS